jgi:hypothetical protein
MKIKDMSHVTVEQVLALRSKAMEVEASHDKLVEALEDLLNDCITFNGSVLSDCYMKQAKEALKQAKGEDQ